MACSRLRSNQKINGHGADRLMMCSRSIAAVKLHSCSQMPAFGMRM